MIPKKIHYCWFGHNPKPQLAEKCIKSWKKYCPGYEIIEWNEDNYDFLKSDFMREAYEAKKWGFVPDYARLDIIYNHGGIYLDTDVEIIKSLDPLLDNRGFMGFESEKYLALGLGFGAEAGNDVIKTLLDSYEGRHFANSDGSLNIIPSPQCDSAVLEELGIERNGTYQKKDGFLFLPVDYLSPISVATGKKRITKNTLTIHWYAGSWLSEEQRRNKKKDYRKHRLNKIKWWIRKKGGGFLRSVIGDDSYEKLKKRCKRQIEN